ncbi:transcription-repair coupling factor [Burkholderia sp. SJ98]|nr:transcription-repair coupling factor [Burkholderia sp. SJ98]
MYASIGRPAIVWYCFGIGAPERLPVPAQGISENRREVTGE